MAKVCSIPQNGPLNLENHRPVAIFSSLGLIFERILYGHMYSFLKPYLSPLQHGFVVLFANDVSLVLDKGGQVGVA